MFIATKNNPKGPNINTVNSFTIDLSGSKLIFSMPNGNCFDMNNPQGTMIDKFNIYQRSISGDQNSDSSVLADRWFGYKGFLGENLGSVSYMLQLYHLDPGNTNLFHTNEFKTYLEHYYIARYKKWNMKADEFSQILPPDIYVEAIINNIHFFKYRVAEQQSTIVRSLYATPIADDCYLEFMFRYISVKDADEPWYCMARQLENKIMSSVNIELTDSEKAAKAAVSQ